MTYYVCKKCYYKHTFLPLECVKCGNPNSNFYPLITSEPTVKLSSCGGMTQEDVLKLRIENEQLKKQIEKMKSDSKTAYIKGIRTMANALKEYDRTDGAWTDYFEHTVEEVLKKLLKESE